MRIDYPIYAELETWASHIGQELLGQPVVLHWLENGLGLTPYARVGETVAIHVSPQPLHDDFQHGEDIIRGLILHEIGHHLVDFRQRGYKTMTGIARSEGFADLFAILRDERLERRLRARRPQWGVYFDRLAAHAFAREVRVVPLAEYAALVQAPPEVTLAALQCGVWPGRLMPGDSDSAAPAIALRESELIAVPHALPPLMAFLACLRGGLDPQRHPDPRVAVALARVPANLKDLSHAEVLQAARAIAAALGDAGRSNRQQLNRHLQRFPHALGKLRRMLDRLDHATPKTTGARPCHPVARTLHSGGPAGHGPASATLLNLGSERDFPLLVQDQRLPYDAARHAPVLATVRPHVRRLRAYLGQLGRRPVEERAVRRGRRLDVVEARRLPYRPSTNLLIGEYERLETDAYFGVLIDQSSSMAEDGRLDRAVAFAVLLAESAKGLPGIEGHVNAFDGDTFYRLGDLRCPSVASLVAGGSNNDAGALARAAELALESRKRHRLLIMISDGLPAECTFASLENLVGRLTDDHGILCAQVAVAPLEAVAFPHYLDLSQYAFDEAVARFGRLLEHLTVAWQ